LVSFKYTYAIIHVLSLFSSQDVAKASKPTLRYGYDL